MSEITKIVDDFYKFAVRLYSKTGQGDDRNFLLSPLTLGLAFGMLYGGARKSSEVDIKHLLCYNDLSNDDIHSSHSALIDYIAALKGKQIVRIANKVYVRSNAAVKQEYKDLVQKFYKNEVVSLDFGNSAEAAKTVQSFIDATLQVPIQRPITPCITSDDINMLLLSTFYFKGNWFKKFDRSQTHKEKFHLLDGTTEEVDMMVLLNRKFKFKQNASELSASVVELPYLDESLILSVILPHEGSDVKEVEGQLTPEVLKEVLEPFDFSVKTDVYLPKFRFEDHIELTDAIKSLNGSHIVKAFRADFTGVSDANNMFVSKTIHKGIFEVDEEGTECHESSNNPLMTWSRGGNPSVGSEQFKCNRPFLFVVHDLKYNIPLFIGKYTKP